MQINESPCGMLICDIDGTANDEAEEVDGDDDDEADSAPAAQLTTSIKLQKPSSGGEVQEWGECTGGLKCAAGLFCNVYSQSYARCLRTPQRVDVCPPLKKRDQCTANVLCYFTANGCRKKDGEFLYRWPRSCTEAARCIVSSYCFVSRCGARSLRFVLQPRPGSRFLASAKQPASVSS